MKKEKDIAPINENLNVPIYEVENIKNLIYNIRGKQVMLDSDLAEQYEVETKRINEAVKRNLKRFPEDFCFKLTEDDFNSLRSQIATLKNTKRGQHRKYLPYAFTEQGVAMLSAVLHSDKAIETSIIVIRAFSEMRKIIANNYLMHSTIESIKERQLNFENKTNEKFEKIFQLLGQEENIKQKVFFEGQIWDSYSLIVDLIKKAKEKIVIIDNYVDDSILKMLSKKNKDVKVIILTSEKGKITNLDVQKFNKEYPTLKLAKTNKFHDRFIIIDNNKLYHCGASIKDLGSKCFAISKIEDESIIKQIINY